MSKDATPRIGVIHTSPATVDLFPRLLRERMPGVSVFNLLDDSILGELAENGGDLGAVAPRFLDYVRIAGDRGADLVMNACSSIGPLCDVARDALGRTVLRVDAAMAEQAVARGGKIAVLATLGTTLRPTTDLIAATATRLGREIALSSQVIPGAYEALIAGDRGEHDRLLASAIAAAADTNDVVVLAQASMARVAEGLSLPPAILLLTSPPHAVEAAAQALGR